jgi:hypothetical protein
MVTAPLVIVICVVLAIILCFVVLLLAPVVYWMRRAQVMEEEHEPQQTQPRQKEPRPELACPASTWGRAAAVDAASVADFADAASHGHVDVEDGYAITATPATTEAIDPEVDSDVCNAVHAELTKLRYARQTSMDQSSGSDGSTPSPTSCAAGRRPVRIQPSPMGVGVAAAPGAAPVVRPVPIRPADELTIDGSSRSKARRQWGDTCSRTSSASRSSLRSSWV